MKDRLPPHDIAAEQGVLGCLLLDASGGVGEAKGEAMEECMRQHVEAAHFYDLRHQLLWAAIRALADAGTPADLVLLSNAMRATGDLDKVGGLAYLNELCDAAPSAANLPFYLEVVLAKHTLRNVIRVAADAVTEAYEFAGNIKDFVGQFESSAMALSETHVPTEFQPLPTFLPAYIEAIESRHRGKQEITGLATPFWYLNNMTAGFQRGQFVVIGARPGTGKTAIGCDIARHVIKQGKGVLFFSLEMSADEIMGRILAAEAKVDGLKLRNGFWTEAKQNAIVSATERLATWNRFFVDSRSECTGQDVYIGTRRAIRQHQIDLVVVDYVQLMKSTREYGSRVQEVAECSAWLRRTAKDLGITVLGLAQLSRESEKDRAGKPPLMSDLRECGNIEQDAHLIGLMYAPRLVDVTKDVKPQEAYHDFKWLNHHTPDDPKEDSAWHFAPSLEFRNPKSGETVSVNTAWNDEFARINLNVVKNRNGPGGACELVFQKRSARFTDAHSPSRTKEERGELI